MGKTTESRGSGGRPDPVRSFNRWKKKHSHKQSQKKQLRKKLKKPEWQVEREAISRLMQNYEKVRPALGRGRRPAAGPRGPAAMGALSRGPGRGCRPAVQRAGDGAGVTGAGGGPAEAPQVVRQAPRTRPRGHPARHPAPREVMEMQRRLRAGRARNSTDDSSGSGTGAFSR